MRLRNVPGSREQIAESKYCINEPKDCRGKWNQIFKNDNPIHIEVGMGKGQFITSLALLHPDINYIGIEMYSSVLVRAIEHAEALEAAGKDVSNLMFIRMDARELLEVFETDEVSKIYLNFSDPWPKERHAKRRLTSVQFLQRYEKIIPQGALVEFKTDNIDLFNFSLEQVKEARWMLIAHTNDLHNDARMNEGNIMTEYEARFSAKGNPINKMIIKRP